MPVPSRSTLAPGIVALVVLAGCLGGPVASGTSPVGQGADPAGQVNLYVSDRPNVIDDFRRLDVTIERVELHRAGGGKVERDVNDTTVDLTRLLGANATLVDSFDVPEGNYTKVFLHVGDVEGVLKEGGETRVKLPSEKLHVDKGFAIGPNNSVDFVFDVSVHEAGNSGKYILEPVVAESGTDVPMESVDPDDEREDGEVEDAENETADDEHEEAETDDETAPDDETESLDAAFLGNVTPGESVTVRAVDANGSAANATVFVDDRRVGTTGSDGRITLDVPPDAEAFEVELRSGDSEAELEAFFGREDPDEGDGDGDGGDPRLYAPG